MTKIEELRAAFEAATSGKWGVRPFGTSHAGAIGCGMDLIAMMYNRNEEEADAHFITLAHNLMPALLEAVEALQNLKQAVEFTPLGVRGIKAVDQARAALEKLS